LDAMESRQNHRRDSGFSAADLIGSSLNTRA
jgi:hypothetical protein